MLNRFTFLVGLFFAKGIFAESPIQLGWSQVAALAQCHEDFVRTGPVKPEFSQGYFSVEPYLAIEKFIPDCLEEKKESYDFHVQILQESGFINWLTEKKRNFGLELALARNSHDGYLLRRWRKKLIAIGMALKSTFYRILEHLLGQLLEFVENSQRKEDDNKCLFCLPFKKSSILDGLNVERYAQMRKQLTDQIANIGLLLRVKGRELIGPTELAEIEQRIQMELATIRLQEKPFPKTLRNSHWWQWTDVAPRVKRVIWLVRHAERLDNVDKTYKRRKDENGELIEHSVPANSVHNSRGQLYAPERTFFWDNSPLSPRGKLGQAASLNENFAANVPISHLFASPLDRTVETARILLGNTNPRLNIKLEAGLIERLDLCISPPSYLSCEELRQFYERIDCGYQSLFRKKGDPLLVEENARFEELDSDGECHSFDEDDMVPRVKRALENILAGVGGNLTAAKPRIIDRDWIALGEEDAVHIVLVSHAATIGAAHQVMAGQAADVVQASISKFVEFEEPIEPKGQTYLDGKKSVLDNFRLIYTSETRHFGEQRKDLVFPY